MPDIDSPTGGPPAGGEPGDGATDAVRAQLSAHTPYADPTSAARAVLGHLREDLGFGSWAVTRVTGGTYVVLATGDDTFPSAAGQQFPWSETLCHRVLHGRVPRLVTDVAELDAARREELLHHWRVSAYVSTPLTLDGSTLFGTLCGVDRDPLPASVADRLPLVDLQARLLSTLLAAELQVDVMTRRAERAEAEALVDPLTGLVNRRGWQLLLDREEQRCRRYGTVASVLVVDLDGLKTVNDRQGHAAGDALLQRAADVLGSAFRSVDAVARLGGDEFAVLAVETDAAGARQERDRLQSLLEAAGVSASVGVAARSSVGGLVGAWAHADGDMYGAKSTRPHRPPA